MEKHLHTWTSPDGSVQLASSNPDALADMVREVEETGCVSHGQIDDSGIIMDAESYLEALRDFRFTNGQVFEANGLVVHVGASFPAGADWLLMEPKK